VALSTSGGPELPDRSLASLALALAASLLLHAALVTLPRWKPQPVPDTTSLTVRLAEAPPAVVAPPPPPPTPAAPPPEAAAESPPPEVTQPPAPPRAAVRKSAREPERSRAPGREAPPPPLVPVPPPAPRPAPEPMPQRDLQAVYERLAQDDQLYPEEAIKRGLSGDVVLIVELDAAGRILGASVATSSGHRILDDAAVRAVRRLGALGAANADRSFLLTIRFVP
jgi:protein TonB